MLNVYLHGLNLLDVYLRYQCHDNYEEYCHCLGKISAITAYVYMMYILTTGQDPCQPDYPCPVGTMLPHPCNCSMTRQCITSYEWVTLSSCDKDLFYFNADECKCDIVDESFCFDFTSLNCPNGVREPPDLNIVPGNMNDNKHGLIHAGTI